MKQELEADGISEAEINTKGLRITDDDRAGGAEADAETAIAAGVREPDGQAGQPAEGAGRGRSVDRGGGRLLRRVGRDGLRLRAGLPPARLVLQALRPGHRAAAEPGRRSSRPTRSSRCSTGRRRRPSTGSRCPTTRPTRRPATTRSRQAMTLSLNTVFYKLASDVGPTNVATLAHAMGIAAYDEANDPATPTLGRRRPDDGRRSASAATRSVRSIRPSGTRRWPTAASRTTPTSCRRSPTPTATCCTSTRAAASG